MKNTEVSIEKKNWDIIFVREREFVFWFSILLLLKIYSLYFGISYEINVRFINEFLYQILGDDLMTLAPINFDFDFVRSFLTIFFFLFPFLIFYVLGFSETFFNTQCILLANKRTLFFFMG